MGAILLPRLHPLFNVDGNRFTLLKGREGALD